MESNYKNETELSLDHIIIYIENNCNFRPSTIVLLQNIAFCDDVSYNSQYISIICFEFRPFLLKPMLSLAKLFVFQDMVSVDCKNGVKTFNIVPHI